MIKGKCCIIGGGSLYRLPVYNQMAKVIDCDYYIGEDERDASIKSYDYDQLINFKGVLKHKHLFGTKFYYQTGALKLLFLPYEYYIVDGAYSINAWLSIILTRFSRKKVFSWSHGMYGRETGARKLIKTVFFKLCDGCLVYNQRSKRLMEECGVNKEKVHCVYNSQDTDADLKVRESLKRSHLYSSIFHNNFPNIVFVGRVTPEKRLDLVIKAIRLLKEKGVYANFMVVGKEVDGVDLVSCAKEEKVNDQVWMYGPCYDAAIIGELFYNASVCVSPGNVGLTAISSLTFGCPVITHDNFSYQGPEFEAIIPGVTGDFFKQGDIQDLAEYIKKWISPDKEKCRDEIRKQAFDEVDSRWNIYSESEVFRQLFTSKLENNDSNL